MMNGAIVAVESCWVPFSLTALNDPISGDESNC